MITSLPIVPAPGSQHDFSIPLLHANSPVLEALNIKQSRDACQEKNNIICIGKLCLSLNGGLPLNKLLSECGVSLKLSLEVSETETTSPQLMINDGVQCSYIDVNEITPSLKVAVCALLCKKKYVRLMVSPINEDVPFVNELILEAWAMESLCSITSPSEVVKFTDLIHRVKQLVSTLTPGFSDPFDFSNVGEEYAFVCVDGCYPLCIVGWLHVRTYVVYVHLIIDVIRRCARHLITLHNLC